MNAQRGKLVSGGRLQIPSEIRKQLGLEDGDHLTLKVVDGELRIRSVRETIRRAQEMVRRHVPEGVSLVDELIAERRAEAAGE